jgi:hypothetical protein
MALPNPFRAHRFIAYWDHTMAHKVSLAVWLIDEVTGQKPTLDVTVRLKGVAQKPVRNPSGYYCFTALADGDYTLVVKADPVRSDWFVTAVQDITLPRPDHLEPVAEIILKPKLSYPFPTHLTLVSGFVTDNAGAEEPRPLADIPVYRLFKFTTDLSNDVVNDLTIQLQNQEFPPELKTIFAENIFIPLEGSVTVTPKSPGGEDIWYVETVEDRQIYTIELRNGQFDIYYRESSKQKGVATKSDYNGEFLLYIKRFERGNMEDGMHIFIEAERDSIRKRQEIVIPSEGVTMKKVDFDFSS